MKAAKADDIAERTLRRARERIGARVERKGFGKGAVWTYDPGDAPSRPTFRPFRPALRAWPRWPERWPE